MYKAEVTGLKKNNGDLLTVNLELMARIDTRTREKVALLDQVPVFNIRIKKLEADLLAKDADIWRHINEREEHAKKVKELKAEINRLEDLRVAGTDIDPEMLNKAEAQIKKLATEVADLKISLIKTNKDLTDVQEERKMLWDKVDAIVKERGGHGDFGKFMNANFTATEIKKISKDDSLRKIAEQASMWCDRYNGVFCEVHDISDQKKDAWRIIKELARRCQDRRIATSDIKGIEFLQL